jgi:hypothetical protein
MYFMIVLKFKEGKSRFFAIVEGLLKRQSENQALSMEAKSYPSVSHLR